MGWLGVQSTLLDLESVMRVTMLAVTELIVTDIIVVFIAVLVVILMVVLTQAIMVVLTATMIPKKHPADVRPP